VVRGGVDAAFAAEAAPWLEATGLLGHALELAAAALPDPVGTGGSHGQNGRLALVERETRGGIAELLGRVAALRDHTLPHRNGPVLVGDGVVDRFLLEVVEHLGDHLPSPGSSGHDVATLPGSEGL
jgi:hypothetical protein